MPSSPDDSGNSRLETKVQRRGLDRRWVVHGDLKNQSFDLAPADGKDLKVFFEHCRLDSVDFSSMSFRSFYAAASSFSRCDFSGTRFVQMGFGQAQIQKDWGRPIRPRDPRYEQTVYQECLFRQTRFDPNNTYFGNVRFVRCVFDRAWLRKLFTWTAEFIECTFIGKVIDCVFHGTITDLEDQQRIGRSTNAFAGNDFREADLIWTAFRGIDLAAQKWPETGTYAILMDPARRIERAMGLAESHLAGDLQAEVLRQLGIQKQLIREERQMLIRRGELAFEAPAEVDDLMWAYLTDESIEP
jgi:uncharacterized protein YjbI with pentapeptide repeats